MPNLPLEIYSSEQGRQFDRKAATLDNFKNGRLMRSAGYAAFRLIRDLWPEARSIVLCCGPGNNGGDGFVIGEIAKYVGFKVSLLNFGPPKAADAKRALRQALDSGASLVEMNSDAFLSADVVVDGILGTGLKRQPSGLILTGIRKINESRKPVLALDVPTGLNPDTGAVDNEAVQATATISFVCLKPGVFMGNGPDRCGRLFFSSLNLPAMVFSELRPVCRRITTDRISTSFERLRTPKHKGEAGHLLIVGGVVGMSGAVRLAAEAALRAGAGSVTVATVKTHAAYLNIYRPELMVWGIDHGSELFPLFKRINGIVIGPGLGLCEWSQEVMAAVLQSDLPLVVDADGLSILAEARAYQDNWILTPHPGEAGTLLRLTPREIQDDRLTAVNNIQETYGGICVLKGAGTLIAGPESEVQLCDRGNSGMASAGMGDILAGIIGAIMVQGMSLRDAAVCGTWIHSAAADMASPGGKRGMVAGDLLPFIRHLINRPGIAND